MLLGCAMTAQSWLHSDCAAARGDIIKGAYISTDKPCTGFSIQGNFTTEQQYGIGNCAQREDAFRFSLRVSTP